MILHFKLRCVLALKQQKLNFVKFRTWHVSSKGLIRNFTKFSETHVGFAAKRTRFAFGIRFDSRPLQRRIVLRFKFFIMKVSIYGRFNEVVISYNSLFDTVDLHFYNPVFRCGFDTCSFKYRLDISISGSITTRYVIIDCTKRNPKLCDFLKYV